MSTSLLLALLASHGKDEEDYSGEYERLVAKAPRIRELMMEELYKELQSTLVQETTASDVLGTLLARTLSDDSGAGLAQAKSTLRATLKFRMDRRFRALKDQYFTGSPPGQSATRPKALYPGPLSTPPIDEVLHQLLEIIIQRMR